MPNGQKARKAVVFGLNGVLEPVKRNCDVINRPRGYVSQHIYPLLILQSHQDH